VADGDLRAARQWADRLLAYHREDGNPNNIAVALLNLAMVEADLNDPACVDHLTEAGRLAEGTERRDQLLAAMHYHLGLAYQDVTAVRDLARAYQEYGLSAELQDPEDLTNRAKCVSQRAEILLQAQPDDPDLTARYRAEALRQSAAALDLFPAEDVADHAVVHERIGRICRMTGSWADALAHDTASRTLNEAAGDTFGQARSRLNVALDLQGLGRIDDARVYAAAAAHVFSSLGERGRAGAERAQRLLAELGG
jgi:tetratricopeptide (TPR) repeat protein